MLTPLQAGSIPQLQSVCMCLIKGILAHYTVLLSQQPPPGSFAPVPGPNGRGNGANHNGSASTEPPEPSAEELDAARTREITAKAVSGIMLLLLKWLKLSRGSPLTIFASNVELTLVHLSQMFSNLNS